MSALKGIGIKVVDPIETGTVFALLHEIADLLDRLVSEDLSGAIDLRAMPLSPADREALRARLGRGEIHAIVDAMGESEIYETRFAGVWWTTHRSTDGNVVAERIEITLVPELLKTHPADAEVGAKRLRMALMEPDPMQS